MGNQSVTKNQTGSVKPLEIIVPQVCGSFKSSRNRNRDFPAVTASPAPSRKLHTAKLERPFASEVNSETIEYLVTLIVSPRLVPTRSIRRPHSVCPMV